MHHRGSNYEDIASVNKCMQVQVFHMHKDGVIINDALGLGEEFDFYTNALEEMDNFAILVAPRENEQDDPYFVLHCSKPKHKVKEAFYDH